MKMQVSGLLFDIFAEAMASRSCPSGIGQTAGLAKPCKQVMVNADGFPVTDFFADFSCDHVCFALVHAKLAHFNVHLENVCDLHWCVEVVADVVGFTFFSTSNLKRSGGSGDGEFFGDMPLFLPSKPNHCITRQSK